MDKEIFGIEQSVDEDGDIVINLKDWAQYEGKISSASDPRAASLPVLKGVQIVNEILQNKLGIPFDWESEETD
jgi:hypothetical protein